MKTPAKHFGLAVGP